MMDKAKAYDEALEKARKLRDDCQKELDKTDKNSQLADLLRAGISAVEMIFPQFIESEDEKFRKYILKCCKECIEANDEGLELSMSTTKKLLAYLEKQEKPKVDIDKLRRDLYQSGYNDGYQHGKEDTQKEQKSDWSEKDEKIIKTIIGVLERDSQVVTCEQRGGTMSASVSYSNKYGEEIAWLKDISLNHKKFIKAVDKLWSNEWSEEDEKDIAHIIQILDDCYAYGRHDLSKTDHENLINKLKSLHSIKQDWTEEDEEIWFALITFFKTYLQKYPPLCKDEKIQANRILKWLNTTIKSFRLHHRYKPTEEQMQALKNSAYGTYQNGDGPALRRLFEDLEKLGVKEHN